MYLLTLKLNYVLDLKLLILVFNLTKAQHFPAVLFLLYVILFILDIFDFAH